MVLLLQLNVITGQATAAPGEAGGLPGGGGGLLTDELMDIRRKGAQPRMRALKHVAEEHGVTHLAAVCAICKTQFAKLLPENGFEMDSIVSIHQLVSNAIVLDGQIDDDDDDHDDDDVDANVGGHVAAPGEDGP